MQDEQGTINSTGQISAIEAIANDPPCVVRGPPSLKHTKPSKGASKPEGGDGPSTSILKRPWPEVTEMALQSLGPSSETFTTAVIFQSTITKQLGSGRYGSVFLARNPVYKTTNSFIALKVIRDKDGNAECKEAYILRPLKTCGQMHPMPVCVVCSQQ